MLFSKGASDQISNCADPETLGSEEFKDINFATKFAKQGLRTLAFAYKRVTESDVFDGSQENLEKDLNILGITAVEDKLQDDVAECVQDFISAGIKVWMLTGDKGETALEIGLSCGMYTKDDKLLQIMDTRDDNALYKQLDRIRREILL